MAKKSKGDGIKTCLSLAAWLLSKENSIHENKRKENKNRAPNHKTSFDKFFALIHIVIDCR